MANTTPPVQLHAAVDVTIAGRSG